MRTLLLTLALLLTPGLAGARPVSYAGGVTAITENDSTANSTLLHYSPTAHFSVGWRAEWRRDTEVMLNALQVNALLHRWNAPDSQANLYLKTGFGAARADGNTEPAAFAALAADWETRRLFTSYAAKALAAGDLDKGFEQRARLGIAPYVAEFGGWHTWLMVEGQHFPGRDRGPWRAAPLVRVFHGATLAEFGVDTEGDVLFNATYRF